MSHDGIDGDDVMCVVCGIHAFGPLYPSSPCGGSRSAGIALLLTVGDKRADSMNVVCVDDAMWRGRKGGGATHNPAKPRRVACDSGEILVKQSI